MLSRRDLTKIPCTNNMTKYDACITVLEAALDMKVRLEASRDSILITSQSNSRMGSKMPRASQYNRSLTKIHDSFCSVSFNYLLRSKTNLSRPCQPYPCLKYLNKSTCALLWLKPMIGLYIATMSKLNRT